VRHLQKEVEERADGEKGYGMKIGYLQKGESTAAWIGSDPGMIGIARRREEEDREEQHRAYLAQEEREYREQEQIGYEEEMQALAAIEQPHEEEPEQ